jgi:uncharacterized protein
MQAKAGPPPPRDRDPRDQVPALAAARGSERAGPAAEMLGTTWATLLRTRRRDGSWVETPVNLVVAGERAYFATPASSGKVKRLRNFDAVEIAPCTLRGTPTGPAVAARARRLAGPEAEAANQLLIRKHGFVHRVVVPLELRLKRTRNVHYELALD